MLANPDFYTFYLSLDYVVDEATHDEFLAAIEKLELKKDSAQSMQAIKQMYLAQLEQK